MRLRRGYRWIVVAGMRWQWKARSSFHAISQNGEHLRICGLQQLVGDLVRGRHKRTLEGIVRPRLAAQLIREGAQH